MEEFICSCIAAFMTALSIVALATLVCSFGFVGLELGGGRQADQTHFLHCHIDDGGAR